jgi:hypothetical protein
MKVSTLYYNRRINVFHTCTIFHTQNSDVYGIELRYFWDMGNDAKYTALPQVRSNYWAKRIEIDKMGSCRSKEVARLQHELACQEIATQMWKRKYEIECAHRKRLEKQLDVVTFDICGVE